MKKKILIGLLIALAALCMGLLSGCFIFGDNGGGTEDTPPPSTDTGLKAPESVRLDVAEKTLYVPDCSASGVTRYQVVQTCDGKDYKIGNLEAADLVAEDGYFAIQLNLYDHPTLELTVVCSAQYSSDVKAKFTYENGGGIIYDRDHCSFNEDTGLFTWTPVEDAVKYWIKAIPHKGFNQEYVVEDTSFVFDDDIGSFYIRPLFDMYKYGSLSREIYLDGLISNPRYDNKYRCFRLGGNADSYIFEITENGHTITKTVSGDELAYEPVSDEMTVKVTACSSIRRTGVNEKTFEVLPAVDVSLNPNSGKLTWSGLNGISEYEVNVEYENGDWHRVTTQEPNHLIQTRVGSTYLTGETNVKILPVSSTSITRYSYLDLLIINPDRLIKPNYEMDEENEKLTVTFRSDSASVDKYIVNCTASGAEDQVLQLKADDFATDVSFRLDLPLNQLSKVQITRDYKTLNGNYCFASSVGEDYSNWVLYAGAPEIEITKNSRLSKSKFIFKVVFPEKLKNRGSFKLKRYYDNDFITKTISDDWSYDYYVPNKSAKITVVYEEFNLSPSTSATLFAQRAQKTITCLDSVDISADDTKLTWPSIEGADGYYVEILDGNYYEEIHRGAELQYIHNISLAGKYSYRVSAYSNDPCVMDSYADSCTIQKLATPTISMNADGKLEITAADAAASIVTLLDGADVKCSEDNLRAVMTDKASATLVAHCMGESTEKFLYITSDDTEAYTLHRIADVTEESMDLTVDAEQNKISWAEVNHVNTYLRRLVRKEYEDGASVLEWEDKDGTTEMDGAELGYGLYELSIKPVGTREGTDFYLYFGDFATSTFRRDGIRAVTVSESGAGFNVDGLVNTDGDYEVSWTLIARINWANEGVEYSFELGADIDLSEDTRLQNYRNFHSSFNEYEFVFSVDYHGTSDEQLSQNKTLKANERLITVRWTQSKAVENFTGTHVRTETGEGENTIKATLTLGEGESLRPFESYYTVYRKVDLETGSWTYVGEVEGTEMDVSNFSGNPIGNCFYLKVKSDQFVEENGKFFFYMSATSSEPYTVAVQSQLYYSIQNQETVYKNPEEPDPDEVYTYCLVSLYDLTSSDEFDVEYLDDNGVWARLYTKHLVGTSSSGWRNSKLRVDSASNLKITAGKEIKLRLRHCGRSETYSKYGTITYEDAIWQYCSFTVAIISEN